MKSEQKSLTNEIIQWHKQRFPHCSKADVNAKVNEEILEFVGEAIKGGYTDAYWDELADLYITHVVMLSRFHGRRFEDVVRDKFARVRAKYGD